MKKIKIAIHNAETGEITERDMTAEELIQYETDRAETIAKLAEAEAKVEAKAAAQAKLAALGLTVEDLQALGL